MAQSFTQKIILYTIILCTCIPQICPMNRQLHFNTTEEATLLVSPVHPWSIRDCRRVVNICRRMLELSRAPATQICEIEKLIKFTQGMIKEIRSENSGKNFGDEQHRLICYKKLMVWEIQKRETWLNIRRGPDQKLKRSLSYESKR